MKRKSLEPKNKRFKSEIFKIKLKDENHFFLALALIKSFNNVIILQQLSNVKSK